MSSIRYLILLVCILHSSIVIGQNSKVIDSLKKLISTQKGSDLVGTFNELAWEYRKTNDSIAIDYANRALKLSKTIKYTSGLATAYVRKATVYLNNNKYEEAEKNLLEALALEEKQSNPHGIARANTQLGKLYKQQQQYDKALFHYNKSLEIRKSLNETNKIALLYNNIALLYKNKKEYNKVIPYYHKSIDLRKANNQKTKLIISYKNLGNFYNELRTFHNALIELKKAKRLALQLQDSIQLSDILLNIGNSFSGMEKADSAMFYYQKSLLIKEKIDQKNKESVYNNIGNIYKDQSNFNKAIMFYQKSIDAAIKNNRPKKLPYPYYNTGNTFLMQKQYQKALSNLHKADSLSEKYKIDNLRLKTLMSLAETYEHLQDYKNASKYNEQHIVLRDSMDYDISLLVDFEVVKEKKKTLASDNEKTEAINQKKTIQFYALSIGCILLTLLFFMLFRSYRLKKQAVIAQQNEKIKQNEIEELLQKQELKSIHAMIDGQEKERKRIAQDLHDRLGSLLSVVKMHYQSVEEQLDRVKNESREQYKKANQLLDEACVAVREISQNIVSGVLTKFGVIAALKELVDNIESTNSIDIELIDYGFDDRIENSVEIHIYRIIQELISNILKHAKATEISIQLIKKENGIDITVIDNGIGFDTTQTRNYSGMGLKGIFSRVSSMDGHIEFDSGRGNGTTVTIEIPIQNQIKNI